MDWNNVPRDWDDPYWLDTQQPDSWRHCISEDIQEIWATFTELQKQTLAADAQKRADNTKTSEGSSGNERRELMQLRLRLQAADCLAATVDCMVHRKVIDARSPIADARLVYGEPLGVDEAEALMRRTRPACER
jgi:hypothetical protein